MKYIPCHDYMKTCNDNNFRNSYTKLDVIYIIIIPDNFKISKSYMHQAFLKTPFLYVQESLPHNKDFKKGIFVSIY